MVVAIMGFTLDMIGKVLLGVSVYLVHTRIIRERKIDQTVIKTMKKERNLALLGLLFIIVGYVMQLPFKISGELV